MRRKPVDNSLIVEKMEAPKETPTIEIEPKADREVTISVQQAVDMLAGYQQTPHTVIKLDTKNGVGKCVICGEPTNAKERSVCWSCHGKYIKEIYYQLSKALEAKEDSFNLKVV